MVQKNKEIIGIMFNVYKKIKSNKDSLKPQKMLIYQSN